MATLINIGHNTSTNLTDASNYTSVTDTTSGLSITTGAALAGTINGLNCDITNGETTAFYARKTASTSTTGTLRCRFYLDVNTLTMGATDSFYLARFYTSSDAVILNVLVRMSSGNYQVRVVAVDDAAADQSTSNVTITDAPHYLEFQLTKSDGSNNGVVSWWIDGNAQTSKTSIDNDTRFANFSYILFGAPLGIDAGTYGTFYLDELNVNDDGATIGAVVHGSVSAVTATATADMPAPVATGEEGGTDATVSAVAATATSGAQAPGVTAGAGVTGVTATASAAAGAPTLTAGAGVSAPAATATAAVSAPRVNHIGTLLDIDHETGDLSEWDNTYNTISATQAAALAGTSYGLALTMDASHGGIADVSVYPSTTGVVRARVYFDPNGLTMSEGREFGVFLPATQAGVEIVGAYLSRSGGNYRLIFTYMRDGMVNGATDYFTISDGPHYIEVLANRATGSETSDGSYQFWIDGSSAASVSSIDNYHSFANFGTLYVGYDAQDGAYSGAYYLDEIVANNTGDEIGPKPQNGSVSAVTATATAQADAPGLSAGVSIAGAAGTATAGAQAPALSAGAGVSGASAAATASAQPPNVSAAAGVAGTCATATAAASAPTVSAQQNCTVSAVTATASAAGYAPAVSAGAGVAGTQAAASAQAIAPAVSAAANVAGTTGSASADAIPPGVFAEVGVVTDAPTMSAAATSSAPSVTGSAAVGAVATTSSAAFIPPAVGIAVTVGAACAAASADMSAPAISAGASIAAPQASAQAQAITPTVSAAGTALISAVAMTAAAEFAAPTIAGAASVAAPCAAASALFGVPTYALTALLNAPAASATAAAWPAAFSFIPSGASNTPASRLHQARADNRIHQPGKAGRIYQPGREDRNNDSA